MLVLACSGLLDGEERVVAPELSVEAAHYVTDPEPAILFELRARCDHTVYESDLPWGNFYSVRLTFRNAAGEQVCPLVGQPIDDPSDNKVQLNAGQVVSGRVVLAPYCRSLRELKARGPVTVEWVYTPAVHKTEGDPVRGRITVPGTNQSP